jgi:pyruvate/2-oxoglutarate dehydrogenase complex dihydrolipoamide acyltransferase (E2) component
MAVITVKTRVSDAAAELARINKIDLAEVKGTGPGRRIVAEDINKAVAARARAEAKEQKAEAKAEPATATETTSKATTVRGSNK